MIATAGLLKGEKSVAGAWHLRGNRHAWFPYLSTQLTGRLLPVLPIPANYSAIPADLFQANTEMQPISARQPPPTGPGLLSSCGQNSGPQVTLTATANGRFPGRLRGSRRGDRLSWPMQCAARVPTGSDLPARFGPQHTDREWHVPSYQAPQTAD